MTKWKVTQYCPFPHVTWVSVYAKLKAGLSITPVLHKENMLDEASIKNVNSTRLRKRNGRFSTEIIQPVILDNCHCFSSSQSLIPIAN